MMYLSDIKGPKENRGSPSKSSPFPECEIETHETYHLNMICIENDCTNKGLICVMCNYQYHRQHKTIPAKIFIDKYRDSLVDFQTQLKKRELKENYIQEIYDSILKELDDHEKKLILLNSEIKNKTIKFIKDGIENLEEELVSNTSDPLKVLDMEINDFDKFKTALNSIFNQTNFKSEIDQITFNHPQNATILLKKFEIIKKKTILIVSSLIEIIKITNLQKQESFDNINNFLKFTKNEDFNNLSLLKNYNFIKFCNKEKIIIGENYLYCMIIHELQEFYSNFLVFQNGEFQIYDLVKKKFIVLLTLTNKIIKIEYLSNKNRIIAVDENYMIKYYSIIFSNKTISLLLISNSEKPIDLFKFNYIIKNDELYLFYNKKLEKYKLIENKSMNFEIVEKKDWEISMDFLVKTSNKNIFILTKINEKKIIYKIHNENLEIEKIGEIENDNEIINFTFNEEKNLFFIIFIDLNKELIILEIINFKKSIKDSIILDKYTKESIDNLENVENKLFFFLNKYIYIINYNEKYE